VTTEQPTAPDWPTDEQLDAVWVELCSFGAEPPYRESVDNPDHTDNRRVLRDALAAAGITAPTSRLRKVELTEAQAAAFAAEIDKYKESNR
jgi:hypothetical protein